MNKKSTLFVRAAEAALTTPVDANEHALATARLETFKAAAADPRDYNFFAAEFDGVRNRLSAHNRTLLQSEEEDRQKVKSEKG